MEHAVVLDEKRCKGCTTCIKICPTQAIRVRNRRAIILPERCIDCGQCIVACPHKAIKAKSDKLDKLQGFAYSVALPDPALFGQFHHLNDVNIVLGGLLKLGFDMVWETARGGALLSQLPPDSDLPKPQISAACPTILRLIQMRFPKLLPHVVTAPLPMEVAAREARAAAVAKTGLKPEEIGVFAIVPCSSQVTAAHHPEQLSQPVVDGALSIADLYLKLLSPMQSLGETPHLSTAGGHAVAWGCYGGESACRPELETPLAVDGIDHCIQLLEEIEDGRLPEADFIELRACTQGCVGGCLTVENPYAAGLRLRHLTGNLPPASPAVDPTPYTGTDRALTYTAALLLDADRSVAMAKMMDMAQLEKKLPGLDCGSCGAPSCHALAEDVVMGRAQMADCIFRVRDRMDDMTGTRSADNYLPAPFRHRLEPTTKE